MKRKLLIWDLDDTLIFTNIEFEKTNWSCAEIISKTIFGDNRAVNEILQRQRKIDLELVSEYGFVRPRYLHSWLRTLEQFCKENEITPSGTVVQEVADNVENLYVRKNENIPEALAVLKCLKEEGYSMVVLTAGDDEIQRKRVGEAGVLEFMDAVYVYPYKTPDTLKEVLAKYDGYICHMIGNSLKSDIHPALENNIWGIHAIRDTWEADHFEIDSNHVFYRLVHNLAEIPGLLREIHDVNTVSYTVCDREG
ncbi:HAD family hydrolase [Brevibacillus sp. NPDC058079]|uniref:HAD family hydrolase n=1 Tax=Brevibacillus sp. NPDC058079 TaxID=3346330 RepID=UPI0036EE5481